MDAQLQQQQLFAAMAAQSQLAAAYQQVLAYIFYLFFSLFLSIQFGFFIQSIISLLEKIMLGESVLQASNPFGFYGGGNPLLGGGWGGTGAGQSMDYLLSMAAWQQAAAAQAVSAPETESFADVLSRMPRAPNHNGTPGHNGLNDTPSGSDTPQSALPLKKRHLDSPNDTEQPRAKKTATPAKPASAKKTDK